MGYMEDLKKTLCDELEAIAHKGEMTLGTLDVVDKLTHSVKSIDTILAMEGYDTHRVRTPIRRHGLKSKLETLLPDAPDDHTREELQRLIDEM